jgi:hypothetical protein
MKAKVDGVTSPDEREKAFAFEGHDLCVAAMKEHPTNAQICRFGSLCLSALCTRGTQSSLHKAGAIAVICDCMRSPASCSNISSTYSALLALFELVHDNAINKAEAAECGCVELTVKACRAYTDDARICTYAVWLIADLAAEFLIYSELLVKEAVLCSCMIRTRWYDNESLIKDALDLEVVLMRTAEKSQFGLSRERIQGIAIGSSSGDQKVILREVDKHFVVKNTR